MDGRRGAPVGSLVGIIGGGLAWLVIAGFVIGDPLVWAPAIASGVALWLGAARAWARHPERHATIVGLVALSVIVICALYVEPVFDRIPDRLFGETTGKTAFPVIRLKLMLGVMAAGAAGYAVWDLQRES